MRVDLRVADARVEVAPAAGGAIASFTHRGRDVLRPTPYDAGANVRTHGCFPLVPYSNRIANARLAFGGATYALERNFGDHPHAIHGVGWQREWALGAHDERSVRLALQHRPRGADARAWPWPFDAWQAIALAADANRALLTLSLGLRNAGDTPFPFGLGFHPYFTRGDATVLGLRAQRVWLADDMQLPTMLAAASGAFAFDPPRAIGASALDNVYAGWDGEASLADRDGALVRLRGDRACRFAVVYAPPARAFVAIEPVTHMTDAFNRAQRGEAATGTRVLAPGAAFSCTMQIESRFAS
jgi:aldose 1-epimerase